MATTAKQLIEILEKYTEPDEPIIWQYYTRADFDYDDQPAPTKEEFAAIADKVGRYDLWEGIPDIISESIYDYKNKKGQE
jgi:hypothetical protein